MRSDLWPEEREATLVELAPNHSAREIAEQLGVSRNAVIGKLHRLGVALRDAKQPRSPEVITAISAVPVGNRTGKHQRLRSAMKAPTPIKPLPQVIAEPVCSHVDLQGLRPHSCRWPVAEDNRGIICLYCGEAANGGPYCATHGAISFVSRDDRKRSTNHTLNLFGVSIT